MNGFRQVFRCHAALPAHAEPAAGRARVRAMDGDEKEARRQVILDAADSLFAARQEMANVADVARAAGLAKGTVYLYFQSKEEIYLALHLRHVEHFFAELIARLGSHAGFCFAQMQSLASQHILNATTYLPLGACCIGFSADAVRPAAAAHFQARLAQWLEQAGLGLERHFPKLAPGEGIRLLKHSYAIMVGLYSLTRSEPNRAPKCPQVAGSGGFQDEASLALTRYWAAVTGIESRPANAHPEGEPDK